VLSGIPDRPLWRRFYDGILERLFARGSDAHVCSSRYLFDYYGKLTSARAVPLLYLPYAFSPHEARAAVADVAAIHSRYGGRKIVLYAGTLSENYGILDLIRAVATLARSRNDFVGVFAGRGHVAERAKSLVTEIGLQDRVFLPGYVNDSELAALMASASAFVCPLRDTIQDWARCPSKLYLYLSHRKPVVTSRIGEAIQIFGDNGLYFEPKNVASMAEKISEALDYTGSDLPDPALHSWEARARTTLKWLQANLPQAFSK
jgi:glycosyltransferase involved in cell wall biosynthesis